MTQPPAAIRQCPHVRIMELQKQVESLEAEVKALKACQLCNGAGVELVGGIRYQCPDCGGAGSLMRPTNASEWFSFPEFKPYDRQNVAFVVHSTREPHINGRVLGGFYCATSGTFSVPGAGYAASLWRPMFALPQEVTS